MTGKIIPFITIFVLFLTGLAYSADADYRLMIRRIPQPPVATNTAKTTPTTRPSSLPNTVTMKTRFQPGIPFNTEMEFNNTTLSISGRIEKKAFGNFTAKVAYQFIINDATVTEPSEEIKSTINTLSIEKAETTLSLKAGQEYVVSEDFSSKWTMMIATQNHP